MRNNFLLKSKVFYPILAVYLFYPFLYTFRDYYVFGYVLINNLSHAVKFLQAIVGILSGLVVFYALWLRKNNKLDNHQTAKYILLALTLWVLFYPYVMTIALIDFAINGWG